MLSSVIRYTEQESNNSILYVPIDVKEYDEIAETRRDSKLAKNPIPWF